MRWLVVVNLTSGSKASAEVEAASDKEALSATYAGYIGNAGAEFSLYGLYLKRDERLTFIPIRSVVSVEVMPAKDVHVPDPRLEVSCRPSPGLRW